MHDLSRESEFLRRVIVDAGRLALDHFGNIRSWTEKTGRGDIVTAADHAVEDLVAERIRKEMPGHNLLTEERGWVREDPRKPVWVLDPVDGTRNFALGVPVFCVSLACVVDGQIRLGAIYDPVHDGLYFAEAGGGAWLGDRPLRVSDTPDLEDSLISVSWPAFRDDVDLYVSIVERVARRTAYFRRIGSAAIIMAHVASGKCDGYIQASINPWDIAAGTLLIREAGGVVTDFHGEPFDILSPHIDLLAASPAVHTALIGEVLEPSLSAVEKPV